MGSEPELLNKIGKRNAVQSFQGLIVLLALSGLEGRRLILVLLVSATASTLHSTAHRPAGGSVHKAEVAGTAVMAGSCSSSYCEILRLFSNNVL